MTHASTSRINPMNGTGVYRISDILDCREYIGSAAVSFKKRWGRHLHDLRANCHCNLLLQKAWNAYGELFFTFDVLEECPPEKCIEREQWWMDREKPEYNILPVAGSPLGRMHTQETCAKISASRIGQKNSLGRKMTSGNREKLFSPLICAIRSEKMRGNRNALGSIRSPLTRAKLSAARQGRHHTTSTRAKMSASKLGHGVMPEIRAKISNGLKAFWKNRHLTMQFILNP